MSIKDLDEKQIKKIFCAAMGWHTNLDKKNSVEKFNKFYDQIHYNWDEDRWTIRNENVQIEITNNLFFRCGHYNPNIEGVGGTAFNLKAVFEILKELDCLN